MNTHEKHHDGILYSCDSSLIQLGAIHDYLSRSYWAEGISKDRIACSMKNSICFGAYQGHQQVGFARVVTDKATFAFLCDVFVFEEFRGRGISKTLVEHVLSHPELQNLRNFLLATKDAHSLYARFGFSPLANPDAFMAISRPGMYRFLRE